MDTIVEKNRASWNAGAARYDALMHTPERIRRVITQPASAFAPETWSLLKKAVPTWAGTRVCVPSSGDNLAVFAMAALGAKVMSCDIAEKQLENAAAIATANGLDISFLRTDTMTLEGVESDAFDLVYTSNGVHVWIHDLTGMYANIRRVLKSGGAYVMYEIHPFCRPFDEEDTTQLRVIKPYTATGPFFWKEETTFGWRISDILNALLDAGLVMRRFEELQAVVNYSDPDWVPLTRKMKEGILQYDPSEVDRMYDWRCNPHAALPQMMTLLAYA